jgi:basic membrane lipoprotein Med (substrate-binding protein (PBP1-ABC) superfamily)
MKLIIIILLLVLSSCSQKQAQPIEKPMVMSATYTSYVSTTTFNTLQAQVTALAAQLTALNAVNATLQKQVSDNQNIMRTMFHEFYIRTDRLDSLRISDSDTLGIDSKFGKIIQLRRNYQLITTP